MGVGAGSYTQDRRIGKLSTDLGKDALLLLNLSASERLSESYTITVEAFSRTPQPLHTLLGTAIGVAFDADDDANVKRDFGGILWEYSELGAYDRGHRYQLVLRPHLHFLTLNKRNRIFQNMSAVDIVKSMLSGSYKADLGGVYDPLDYCVQYQESDFDFISRLMEYEGIYYYYAHTGAVSELVLVDDANAHPDMTPASVMVAPEAARRPDAPIWSVTERRGLGPAKVTVADYDFEAPSKQLQVTASAAKILGTPTTRGGQSGEGSHGKWAETAEMFDFPAKYTSKSTSRGDHYSDAWLHSHRRRMARSFADGTLFAAAVGRRLTLTFEDITSAEYLIVGTAHHYSGPTYHSGEGEETFSCLLELMPAAEQYRPPLATPRPRIMGPQTAIVVGPSGEEIHTDTYGRIKVQFFWDRDGKNDENSGCFIRVVQAGAGQGWGSFALPRIGQEVVVEFLDGDPDRPLVTGAVYNASNTPPAALPDNKTQFGMKSRITTGGGGHNRLWFDDKKGEEVVWFRAERDYKVHVVNQDEERNYDKGNRTTTIHKGNEQLTVSKGTRTTTINDDETLEVKMGNRATKISMGNDTLKVAMGDVAINVDLGKHSTKAMQSIELTCGPSKIKIDPMQISMEAMTVKIEAKLALQLKGLMIQSEASAMQIVKGGIVMIN
jgi:type VI secretion system secreted protein VgrG